MIILEKSMEMLAKKVKRSASEITYKSLGMGYD